MGFLSLPVPDSSATLATHQLMWVKKCFDTIVHTSSPNQTNYAGRRTFFCQCSHLRSGFCCCSYVRGGVIFFHIAVTAKLLSVDQAWVIFFSVVTAAKEGILPLPLQHKKWLNFVPWCSLYWSIPNRFAWKAHAHIAKLNKLANCKSPVIFQPLSQTLILVWVKINS